MLKLSSLYAPLAMFSLLGCGTAYQTTYVKNYRLAIAEGDRSLSSTIRVLISDFNQRAGRQVLTYEDSLTDANSAIIITKDLEKKTEAMVGSAKVGLGQWLAETRTDNPLLNMPGEKLKKTVYYAMRLEFDYDYMNSRSFYDQQKLFFHEVGHGLELDHNTSDSSDVMYPDVGVGETKDFNRYFEYVRSYVSDSES